MSDIVQTGVQAVNTATLRTGVNAVGPVLIALAIERFTDVEVDLGDPLDAALVVAAYTAWYRVSRLVGDRWRIASLLLFGTDKGPAVMAPSGVPVRVEA